MNTRVSKISKALLDISQCADVVLRVTNGGVTAMRGKGLSNAERCLLERIDGFRSLEQILAISGDVIGLYATLGKLLALGMVAPEGEPEPRIAVAPAPQTGVATAAAPQAPQSTAPAKPLSASLPAKSPAAPANRVAARSPAALQQVPMAPPKEKGELAQAKALLRVETGYLFSGDKAKQVVARVDACKNTEEIYDLIVKLQGLLAKSGKADPDVFLERLTTGLAKIRAAQRAMPPARPAA